MKTYITDENGNLIFSKLMTLFVGLSLVAYISSLSWYQPDINASIKSYVININKSCPIQNSSGMSLDSVTFDGNNMITQHFSGRLKKMEANEFDQMKKAMYENTKSKLSSNQEVVGLIMKNDVKIKHQFLNLNNRSQMFDYVIDKSMIKKNDY